MTHKPQINQKMILKTISGPINLFFSVMVSFVIFVVLFTMPFMLMFDVAARFSFQILEVFRIGESRKLRSFVGPKASCGLLHLTKNLNGEQDMLKVIVFIYLAKLKTCTWSLVFLGLVLGIVVTLFAMLSSSVMVMIFTVVHFNQ
jgi:hypothetical protein